MLAFTCLGHEYQDLLSLCNEMHVYTDLGLYCHLKEFWGSGVRSHVHSKGKIPPLEGQGRMEPVMLHHAGQSAQHPTD